MCVYIYIYLYIYIYIYGVKSLAICVEHLYTKFVD